MALPKRRHSRARRDKRRVHHHAAAPTLTRCGQCGGFVAAHHACPACGYYRGRSVLDVSSSTESSGNK